MAMHDCDLMICVGARFDDRVTGRIDAFSPNSKKVHIDIDPSSINKIVRVDVPIVADCGAALEALITVREGTASGKKRACGPEALESGDRRLARAQLLRL
jgi:thiamine pyrophosphate-dependent acetolactate synthase large subunit-like protein